MQTKKIIENVIYCMVVFAVLTNCTEPVSPQIHNGLWKKSNADNSDALFNDWIPSEYHIKEDGIQNGNIIYRVRILDPLACTDSYTPLIEDTVSFSQYNLYFVIRFESDSTASVEISRADSSVTYQLYKSNEEPYWGGCL